MQLGKGLSFFFRFQFRSFEGGWHGWGHWVSAFLGIVGLIGMSYAWLPVMSMFIVPVVRLFALDGPDRAVGVGGWGCCCCLQQLPRNGDMGVNDTAQWGGYCARSSAHDVDWRDDGLNVAVSQRGAGGDCTLLHKL